jgi:hypothetical protein
MTVSYQNGDSVAGPNQDSHSYQNGDSLSPNHESHSYQNGDALARPSQDSHSYKVLGQPLGQRPEWKIICVGAGASGLYLAYSCERKMQNYNLTIYEKNPDVGGTWLESMSPRKQCSATTRLTFSQIDIQDALATFLHIFTPTVLDR